MMVLLLREHEPVTDRDSTEGIDKLHWNAEFASRA
jgi:hypothetical protein